MQRRPSLTLFLTAWSLLAVSCLLTAPSDDELVGACDDDTKNGGESDADCGGPCGQCGTGRTCAAAADCSSGVCASGVCEAPSCSDGVKNGAESDVDCGETDDCLQFCLGGQHCNTALDCEAETCVDNVCGDACIDGILSGEESDVDCGGRCPSKCDQGLGCYEDVDCTSGLCDLDLGVCQ
jgi:hypothetical protein